MVAGVARHVFVLLFLGLSVCLRAAGADVEPAGRGDAAAAVVVTLSVDREDGIYRCGEMAAFTATVTKDGKPVDSGSVTIRVETMGRKSAHEGIQKVDDKPLQSKKVVHEEALKVAGLPLQTRMTYDRPDFLVGWATYSPPDGRDAVVSRPTGLGFDPEKIEAVASMPDDFDAFWRAAREERDAIPLDLKLTPCPNTGHPAMDVFKISVANINNTRAYGYLLMPKNDAKGPLSVVVSVPGAGDVPKEPPNGQYTHMLLSTSVHAYDPPPYDESTADVRGRYDGEYKHAGAPDRKKYYFYRAILGIDRLIGYVASRPDVDRSHFSIKGVSQGGGLALILGGLNNDKFTSVYSGCPGMCDHASYRVGRPASWPVLILPKARKGTEEWVTEEQRYLEFSAYFDAVNFARRIKCPTMMWAGLGDSTCPAVNIYAAYNVIQAPKRIFTCQGGHPSTPRAMLDYSNKEWDEALKTASEEIGRAAASRKEVGEQDAGKERAKL